mmetsp:Transcript_10666/g.28023  ORF Transcript_10666/g.28023 Transcript_10666/m.28023 type:complete len:209 (-) Transcript_10666:107-733(-)
MRQVVLRVPLHIRRHRRHIIHQALVRRAEVLRDLLQHDETVLEVHHFAAQRAGPLFDLARGLAGRREAALRVDDGGLVGVGRGERLGRGLNGVVGLLLGAGVVGAGDHAVFEGLAEVADFQVKLRGRDLVLALVDVVFDAASVFFEALHVKALFCGIELRGSLLGRMKESVILRHFSCHFFSRFLGPRRRRRRRWRGRRRRGSASSWA